MQRALIVAVIAGVAYVLYKLKRKHFADEDRPEIIVTNRKLKIGTGKDWRKLGSDKKWKPDHDAGKSVVSYEVTATNSTNGCAAIKGAEVAVDFKTNNETHTFLFRREFNSAIQKFEPIVVAPVDLEHDGNRRKLKIKVDPDGGITQVRVDGTPCNFPADSTKDVEIRLKMHYLN